MADKKMASAEGVRLTIERCNRGRTIEMMEAADSPLWTVTFPGYSLSATAATAETNLELLKKLGRELKKGTDCSAVFTAINAL